MYKKTWLALAVLALGGCRIVSQQELADLKSPPNPHMANIDQTWQDKVVPQIVSQARPVAELMTALRTAKDIDSACKTLGYRAQDENPCIFYVKVEGNITHIDSTSRSGKMTIQDTAAAMLWCKLAQRCAARSYATPTRTPVIRTLTTRFCLANMARPLTNMR